MLRALFLSLCLSLLVAPACSDDGHGDHCTTEGEQICDGQKIRTCDGEHYGEPADCPPEQECHVMPDGLNHCMLSAMIHEGHDDHGDHGEHHSEDQDAHGAEDTMDHDDHDMSDTMDMGPDSGANMADR